MLEMTTISVVFKRRRRKRLNDVEFSVEHELYGRNYNRIRGGRDPSLFAAEHTFVVEKNSRCKFVINGGEEVRQSCNQVKRDKQITNNFNKKGRNKDYNKFSMLKGCLIKETNKDRGPKSTVNFSETNNVLLRLTCVLLILFTKVTCQVNCDATTAPYYYANLPKFGYISGARLKVLDQQGDQQSGTNQYVAAFLGIPYAAPPIGLLRLMPPGANPITSAHQLHQEQHLLLPSRQRHSVKAHTEFAHECVRLSDWLGPTKGGIPFNRADNESKTQVGVAGVTNSSISRRELERRKSGSEKRREARDSEEEEGAPKIDIDLGIEIGIGIEIEIERLRKRQSEDCLNLNVFIPINESNNKHKQTTNNHDHELKQKHQIKLNYPSQYFANQGQDSSGGLNRKTNIVSTSTNHNNSFQDDLDNKEKSDDQELGRTNHQPLWNIKSESEEKLPVLVLFHGTNKQREKEKEKEKQSKANALDYLSTAHLLNSIVITFNYRIGLLGFLPYIDEEASLDVLKAMPRNNHAIWDLLGLLHWLKHNIAAFQGDPNNIALLPLDNEATQFVQLLTLSPLSKGLFNRVFLVHDETRATNEMHLNLDRLLSSLDDTRDLRRKLIATLSSIVKQITSDKQQTSSGRVFDFIQAASLFELAQIDQQLNQLGSEQLIAIANEPTLYDKVLFPHLSLFTKGTSSQLETSLQQSRLNLTILQSEVNYCLYLRQLSTTGFDPFNLISNLSNNSKSLAYSNQVIPVKQQTSENNQHSAEAKLGVSNWYRDTSNNGTTKINNFFRRTQTAIYFNHMQQVFLLNKYLNNLGRDNLNELIFDIDTSDNNSYEDIPNKSQLHDYDEDQQQQTIYAKKLRKHSSNDDLPSAINRRSISDHIGDNINQLMPSIPSFDLMVGFIKTSSNIHHDLKKQQSKPFKDFQNIDKILMDSADHLDEQLLFWLKFADYHFIANSANNRSNLAQLCGLDNILTKSIYSMKTSHVFIVDSDLSGPPKHQVSNKGNWLLDVTNSPQMMVGLTNFLKYGNANNRNNQSMSSYWPIYNSLERKIKRFSLNVTTKIQNSIDLTKQIRIQIDILPYLSSLNSFINNSSNNTNDLQELFLCLNDIDTAISESNFIRSDAKVDDSSPASRTTEFQDHLKCLSASISRIKNRIRQYGSEDLEPLMRHIKLQTNRHLESGHNGASSSSITTRNLVDEGPILNNLEQSDAASQLEIEVASSNGSSLIAYVSSNNLQDQANSNLKKNSMGIKGFLANAYKDPVGKALTLVVGTGLLIFLLNLIIVAIITFRSSRTRRRSTSQQNVDNGQFSCSPNQQQSAAGGIDNFVQNFGVNNNKKSTLKKNCRRFDSERNKGQTLNSSFRGNQQGNNCSTTNSKCTKQLKFDLSGVLIGKSGLQEEDYKFNNQYDLNENKNQQMVDAIQMIELQGIQDGDNNNRLECYPAKDKQIMMETITGDFSDDGILLSISPMLAKYNSSCNNEHLCINDETKQEEKGMELEDQKLWPNFKIAECNEFYFQQCAEQQTGTTFYHDDNYHLHLHHQYNNSMNSPITSTQSNSTFATVCPTNTSNSFNNSSLEQKIRRDMPSCSTSSRNNQLNNKLSCLHQNHQHHHIQNQSSASPGSSATLSVTPIPIQLESLTLTQAGGPNHHNFQVDSVYQIENNTNFLTLSNQTGQITQQLDNTM